MFIIIESKLSVFPVNESHLNRRDISKTRESETEENQIIKKFLLYVDYIEKHMKLLTVLNDLRERLCKYRIRCLTKTCTILLS